MAQYAQSFAVAVPATRYQSKTSMSSVRSVDDKVACPRNVNNRPNRPPHALEGGVGMDYPELFAGLDPGQSSGGIAFVGDGFAEGYPMPDTEKDVAELLEQYARFIVKAYIEAVHSFPGQGVHSMFVFGRSYGFLRGLLIGLKIPFEEVSPQRWTKDMRLVGGKKGTEKKNLHKSRCQELFPHLKITHAIADALLLAEFGRRRQGLDNGR